MGGILLLSQGSGNALHLDMSWREQWKSADRACRREGRNIEVASGYGLLASLTVGRANREGPYS